jgi:transposase
MAQPYSNDLRCKLLEAYEAGAGSLRALALQFRVSWGYSKKIRAQQLLTGSKERLVQSRRGPVSRVTEAVKEQLRRLLEQQADLSLEELRQALAAAGAGVQLSRSRMGQVVQQLGLRRKKNPSTPRNVTARPIGRGARPFSNKSTAGQSTV